MRITRDVPSRPDRAYLDRLLSDRNHHPARAEEIDREVWRAFTGRADLGEAGSSTTYEEVSSLLSREATLPLGS